ncbi:MAG TPA: hypothetical protein VLM18_06175 [Croceibacterium sp.]|nr:hypothetical protein [Croceibacterium sp.]
MIFHLSIDARDPQHVATVIAELFGGGQAVPFPPVAKGSWVALALDERNTTVEVYPRGTVLQPGDGDADGVGLPDPSRGTDFGVATHFAMASPLTQEDILGIAQREGWPAKYRKRGGFFGVIEMWIEGDRMVEVLTAEMQAEYLAALSPENVKQLMASVRPQPV